MQLPWAVLPNIDFARHAKPKRQDRAVAREVAEVKGRRLEAEPGGVMIPLRDNIPTQRVPVVNYAILAFTSIVFAAQVFHEDDPGGPVERYGMVPARVFHPDRPLVVRDEVPELDGRNVVIVERVREAAPSAVPPIFTLLTCIFLHGGWLHFLGNMWFLYIFGDNVEDRFGRIGYLLFYLLSGVAASAAHLFTNADSTVPTIGASGAIAGVMGAYFYSYPHAKVVALVPIFFFLEILVLPAPLFLGFWFLLQFVQGIGSVTATEAGGVAWWAHIGGFAVGFLVSMLLSNLGSLRPKVQATRPQAGRIRTLRDRSY